MSFFNTGAKLHQAATTSSTPTWIQTLPRADTPTSSLKVNTTFTDMTPAWPMSLVTLAKDNGPSISCTSGQRNSD